MADIFFVGLLACRGWGVGIVLTDSARDLSANWYWIDIGLRG